MSAPIKTDWFSGDKKPVRPGVYERAMPWGDDEFSKWDGENWINAATTREDAARHTGVSHYQEQPWRGVVPEVLGCIPVEADAENTCLGCYFLDDHVFLGCASACRAVNCSEESIIWRRPRKEGAPMSNESKRSRGLLVMVLAVFGGLALCALVVFVGFGRLLLGVLYG